MTVSSLYAGRLSQPQRRLVSVFAAIANTFQAIIEVFAEAGAQSSAARSRFPLAD
jgi:hypothetical protein